jgi:hypothetical protein
MLHGKAAETTNQEEEKTRSPRNRKACLSISTALLFVPELKFMYHHAIVLMIIC